MTIGMGLALISALIIIITEIRKKERPTIRMVKGIKRRKAKPIDNSLKASIYNPKNFRRNQK